MLFRSLTLAHSVIVDKHGGAIACESEEGRGTTFTITIPLVGSSQNETQERAA